MKMIKTSILDYEVRFDINKEYIRFIDRLNHTKISYDGPYSTFANEFSFIEDFEENIEYFPFNKTSRTFNEFLLDRGIEDGRIPVKEKV